MGKPGRTLGDLVYAIESLACEVSGRFGMLREECL